ncbi:GIY-YIG nuclease family protein [Methylobacterium sp. NPDC080182]|uniref:GIY-YIG nuclease family protein n=1 Tax=Methylobacterium sp. NPDC080182 TaxID=3390590 RepID=UPI003D0520B3
MARDPSSPIVSGIYFLFRDGALAYVGKSHDCHRRIAKHRANGRVFDFATVMPLRQEFIGDVEKALISAYTPPDNRAVPPAAQAVAPTPPAPVVKAPDLTTVSVSQARTIALRCGLPAAAIDEAIAVGDLKFVDSGRRTGRGIVRVAMASAVTAYCEHRAQQRLIALGLVEAKPEDGAILQ